MGRRSLAEVRKPQLLEAYEACLARYGVEGTTLDRVAREAGVTRGLVRHYLGNRGEVLRAVVAHVREQYADRLQSLMSGRPQADRLSVVMDAMLSGEGADKLYGVAAALFAEGMRDREVAGLLREMYLEFERTVDVELAAAYPGADPRARRDVAFAILGLAFATSDFRAVGVSDTHLAAARRAADALVATLVEHAPVSSQP